MSPQRLFKRWIASEHQHLGSPSPLMPVSHPPVPKCYSAWCLRNSGWRKIRNVMTDFLSPAHSLTVAVEKRKKQKTKSTEDAWVQFTLWFSAVNEFGGFEISPDRLWADFLFPYGKFDNYVFTQRCINSGVCGKPQKWSVWKVKMGLRSKCKLK